MFILFCPFAIVCALSDRAICSCSFLSYTTLQLSKITISASFSSGVSEIIAGFQTNFLVSSMYCYDLAHSILFYWHQSSNLHIFLRTLRKCQLSCVHLQHTLLFLFNQNRKTVECHHLQVETYGLHTLTLKSCWV